MAEQAKITSVEVLERFRSSLILFLADARRSLDEVGDSVRRTKSWLENEQRAHWEQQLRKRMRILVDAQQELFAAKLSPLRDATAQQEELVRKARRAVAEAEEKQRNVKKWNRNYDSAVEPLAKRLEGLRHFLDHDLMKAVSYLVHQQKTLEGYLEAGPPPEAAQPPTTTPTEGQP
jgi:hypothetical protein